MPTSKEEIKEWLERTGRDRQWLADQCGASKNTVNNWLSTNINVPSKALRIIETLMRADHEAERASNPTPSLSIVLEVDPDRFDSYNRAATAHGMIIREWAVDVLNKAAERDAAASEKPPAKSDSALARSSSRGGPVPFPSPAGEPKHWIDLRGGIAAGVPISGHVVAEPIPAAREYPEDHYALRVFGASMEPKIPDGSTIIVQKWPLEKGAPKRGTIVVYSDGSGSTLKEFGYRKAKPGEDHDAMGNVPVLRSLNKAFPDVQTMDGGRIDAVLVEVV